MIIKTDNEVLDFRDIWAALRAWWDQEAIARIGSWPRKYNGQLLLGCPVYGEKFIRTFKDYCLQSVYCGANLEALRGSALMLFTDAEGMAPLASLRTLLQPEGVDVVVKLIPDSVTSCMRHSFDHMWILGVCHTMSLKEAGHRGYDWHMLLPDHCYGDGYFPNLKRLGAIRGAIAQTSLSANIETAGPELDKYRTDDGLVIPQRNLGTIGWKHLHDQMQPLVMDDRTDYAGGVWLIYKGMGEVSIYSPWMNAAFLSNALCVSSPTILPATVDTQLAQLMPNGAYIPKAEDGLCFIELSGADKPATFDHHLSADEFCIRLWDRLKFKNSILPFFSARGSVPIHVEYLAGMSEGEIEGAHNTLVQRLMGLRGEAAWRFCEREVK